jgi:magnesium-transporting ATPase (P-type)
LLDGEEVVADGETMILQEEETKILRDEETKRLQEEETKQEAETRIDAGSVHTTKPVLPAEPTTKPVTKPSPFSKPVPEPNIKPTPLVRHFDSRMLIWAGVLIGVLLVIAFFMPGLIYRLGFLSISLLAVILLICSDRNSPTSKDADLVDDDSFNVQIKRSPKRTLIKWIAIIGMLLTVATYFFGGIYVGNIIPLSISLVVVILIILSGRIIIASEDAGLVDDVKSKPQIKHLYKHVIIWTGIVIIGLLIMIPFTVTFYIIAFFLFTIIVATFAIYHYYNK